MCDVYGVVQIVVAFWVIMAIIIINNTPHASRKICAPWGVTFKPCVNDKPSTVRNPELLEVFCLAGVNAKKTLLNKLTLQINKLAI